MKKISIIVAVYNVEKYLERCLDSIVNQSYKNVEIIIVNDGSTDASSIIINNYFRKNDTIKIVNKSNGGLSDERNAGIEEATGEYILFVDGDDWLDKDCLKRCSQYFELDIDIIMFSFLREYGNMTKKADLFTDKIVVFENEKKDDLVRRLVGPIGTELRNAHRMEDLNPAWNKLYNKQLIKSSDRFVDTRKIGTEDLWFNLQMFSKAKKIVYIDVEGYHYNKENTMSLTRVYNKHLFERWKTLYGFINDFISSNPDSVYSIALNNRIVLNLLALTRNIVCSDLPKQEKIKEINQLLEEPMYERAFSKFKFENLSFVWKVFYKLCKQKKSNLIYKFLICAEEVRKWA